MSSVQLLGMDRANARNASSSESKLMTQLCACVPKTGMPYLRPASTFEVDAQPAT